MSSDILFSLHPSTCNPECVCHLKYSYYVRKKLTKYISFMKRKLYTTKVGNYDNRSHIMNRNYYAGKSYLIDQLFGIDR